MYILSHYQCLQHIKIWDLIIKNYPNAFDYYKCEITLPLYSLLTDEEAKYVIQILLIF